MFDRIKRAWAVWYLANVSFGCNLTACFGYYKGGTRTKVIKNKRNRFTEELAERIQNVQIECCDALKIIRSRNSVDTLFYLEPPYVGSDQGHYTGYWQSFFDALLGQLEKNRRQIPAEFFPEQLAFDCRRSKHLVSNRTEEGKTNERTDRKNIEKIEVLTANYLIGVVDGEEKHL